MYSKLLCYTIGYRHEVPRMSEEVEEIYLSGQIKRSAMWYICKCLDIYTVISLIWPQRRNNVAVKEAEGHQGHHPSDLIYTYIIKNKRNASAFTAKASWDKAGTPFLTLSHLISFQTKIHPCSRLHM